jgi:hypothetical protein
VDKLDCHRAFSDTRGNSFDRIGAHNFLHGFQIKSTDYAAAFVTLRLARNFREFFRIWYQIGIRRISDQSLSEFGVAR